jgi:hypothetical protein
MTNAQAPMTSQTANPNDETAVSGECRAVSSLSFRHSMVIGAWSLVIQRKIGA